MMKLGEYLDTLNLELVVRRYHNQDERWCASLEHVEIKDDAGSSVLASIYGDGKNSDEAIAEYLKLIKGKLLVVHATATTRREYLVPESLTWNGQK